MPLFESKKSSTRTICSYIPLLYLKVIPSLLPVACYILHLNSIRIHGKVQFELIVQYAKFSSHQDCKSLPKITGLGVKQCLSKVLIEHSLLFCHGLCSVCVRFLCAADYVGTRIEAGAVPCGRAEPGYVHSSDKAM
ncbi:hypothetical protein V6N12_005024 [Hibiscus sabdariffa]|uniref:Uncharacterized protein n=1 Tax=Hibiscus sabdariffa TaxID=183260 RepID=A0ABR2CNK4_9ROSI